MSNLQKQFQGYLNTPSLFEEFYGLQQFELDIKELEQFDSSKLELSSQITLGRRVEDFFRFYINESSKYDLVKHNIQIIEDKQTLGELDFILFDKKAYKYIHVEHIYKFYLYDDSIQNEIDRYIGPNRNDTLIKKITKLQTKQLPLLYKSATSQYLNNIDSDLCDQKVCFKGNIYVPLHLENSTIPLVNNSCVRGFYLSMKEFVSKERFRFYEYFLPDKFDWVSNPSSNEIWYSFDEVIQQIEELLQKKKSSLVWLKDRKNNIEKSFFVTWW